MEIQEDKLYKLTEVCKITGIGRSTANLYAQQGVLKCIKIGKVWRMKGKDLKELLEHGTEPEQGKFQNETSVNAHCVSRSVGEA